MKKKYYWIIIAMILIFILIGILIPKNCGSFGGMSTTIPQQQGSGSKCQCAGYSYEDWSLEPLDGGVTVYCIGICHSCQSK